MRDIFRPKNEPARSIYDAFQKEAQHRDTCSDWIKNERRAVYKAVVDCAQKYGLKVPTMEDVVKGENLALGHTDYGAKWTYYLVNIMKGK
jgi:hypothetical protein